MTYWEIIDFEIVNSFVRSVGCEKPYNCVLIEKFLLSAEQISYRNSNAQNKYKTVLIQGVIIIVDTLFSKIL